MPESSDSELEQDGVKRKEKHTSLKDNQRRKYAKRESNGENSGKTKQRTPVGLGSNSPSSAEVQKQIVIDTAKRSDLGRRRYDKRNCCLFCSKQCAKMGRHILTVHKNEMEVSRILGTTTSKSLDTKMSWGYY